jgi:hypothetical protein
MLLFLITFVPVGGSDDFDSRERHPFAPSLPLLTKEEEAQIQRVIDRFIQYEMGKLDASEGGKAVAALKALGPEATPGLVHGLNRAANLGGSCPAVVLARKLDMLVSASNDRQLLDFVRENVGLGVTVKRHMNALQQLRLTCLLRKGYLARNNIVYQPPVRAATSAKAELSRLNMKEAASLDLKNLISWLADPMQMEATACHVAVLGWPGELVAAKTSIKGR